MKKRKIVLCIVIAVVIIISLIPFKLGIKDGGSVIYRSLTYKVYKYHRGTGERVGTRVEIFGIGVYDNYNEPGKIYLKDHGNFF